MDKGVRDMEEKKIRCPKGADVKECLRENSLLFFDCGGRGTCGKCRGRVLKGDAGKLTKEEETLLTEKEKAENVRLFCQIRAVTDLELSVEREKPVFVSEYPEQKGSCGCQERRLGLALDMGTTTLAGLLVDLETGRALAEGTVWNPQGCYGADIISRMQYCLQPGGTERMQKKLIEGLRELLDCLTGQTGEIVRITAAGNSAMTHFLLGRKTDTLAYAPFQPEFFDSQSVDAEKLGIPVPKGTELLTLPLLQGQIGGDITGALLSVDIFEKGEGTLLFDLGTNGEIAFYWKGKIYVCSTAAGPALEGAGISCGMRAQAGAIESVWLTGGNIFTKVIGNRKAEGICGSALIDAVSVLLDLGKIHPDGYLEGERFFLSGTEESGGVFLTQEDIRQYQLVKAAIRAGMEAVVHAADAEQKDISGIYIAGAFGNSLRKRNAVRTGLLPDLNVEITAVGNASLKGAALVMVSENARKYVKKIQDSAVLVPLAEAEEFKEAYIREMGFP